MDENFIMDFKKLINKTIVTPFAEYEVQEVLGSGGFGVVLQCHKKPTNEIVALKLICDQQSFDLAEVEEMILTFLKHQGSDNFHIVTCNNIFMWEETYCFEFEKLDVSLYEYLNDNTLSLQEIRPILYQLVKALWFLEFFGIIHADLKPENIMMVDQVRQPLKVKLIDFGLAITDPEELKGEIRGTFEYTAPEMLLGAPFNQRLDIWSLGCVAVEMLIGRTLFEGRDLAEIMQCILKTTGLPPNHVMSAGCYTDQLFNERTTRQQPHIWSLKSPCSVKHSCLNRMKSLHDILEVFPDTPEEDVEALELDRLAFVDLVTKMLHVDPDQRITPEEMLNHPFFTLEHLELYHHSNYVELSAKLMEVCNNWNLEEEDFPSDPMDCSSPDREEYSNEQNSEEKLSVQETFRRSSYNLRKRKRKRNDTDSFSSDSSMVDSDNTPQPKRRKRKHIDTDQAQNHNAEDKANAILTPQKREREDDILRKPFRVKRRRQNI